jgi:hypothetical protein|tara:strand:- start:83 stop:448 length:366 start_codon:yes stop_codon:yes gene_type:complete
VIRPSSKQFFWLFLIVGTFLAIFLWINDYFSHQIFIEELGRQISLCSESSKQCEYQKLIDYPSDRLNANQAKIVELSFLIAGYFDYMIKTLKILVIFILIGSLPALKDIYNEIRSRLNLNR